MLALCALLAAQSCAFPRKGTPLSALSSSRGDEPDRPEDLWRLVVVSADIPREKRSGLPWDAGDPPDPYVRISASGKKLWQSATLDDTLRPEFNAGPSLNLALPRSERLRIELWDADGVSADPIGIYEGRALGEAIMGSDTLLKLEGGATLTVRVERPLPHRGLGIALYEIHKDALRIVEVLPRSPASRAGLVPGDRIVAIGGKSIAALGAVRAESALVLSAQEQRELRVEDAKRRTTRTVVLDRGHVWLAH